MNRKNTRRGFTLIELLVVVIIIAILAAVALPQYQKAVKKSRAAEIKLTVKAIWDAEQRKNLEMGTHNKAYDFKDLDVSFTDKDGNTAAWTESVGTRPGSTPRLNTNFYTKNAYYDINDSYPSFDLILRGSPTNLQRDGNYHIEINNKSDGKFVCWTNSNDNDCSIVLPGATASTDCSSGSYCYVE